MTYDIEYLTYDIVCWHTTSYVHTMSYTIWTYDIVCHVHTTLYVHFRHTTLYTICGDENGRCRMCHIRCRMLTYDIVRHVRCRTYDVVRLYPVYRTYDIVRTMFNTTSYVAHTMSYVHDVRHRTWRTTSQVARIQMYISRYTIMEYLSNSESRARGPHQQSGKYLGLLRLLRKISIT